MITRIKGIWARHTIACLCLLLVCIGLGAQGTNFYSAAQLQGYSISTTAPTDGQTLTYVGSTKLWTPTADPGTGTVTVIHTSSPLGGGDITTTGTLTCTTCVTTATLPASTGWGNCSSAASPAVCGSANAGSVVIAASASTVVVNTSAVTANSQILLTPDETLGTKLTVTCNSTAAQALAGLAVTSRSAGVSFTITTLGTIAVNPACLSYLIIN